MPQDVVRTFQEAFKGCGTLLLAGGGNLTSQFGGLLTERLAAIRVAHAMGLKVVVSGQTVGPVLTGPDSAEATEALRLCGAVGARERHTYNLLSSLDVESVQVLDDAAFLRTGWNWTLRTGRRPGTLLPRSRRGLAPCRATTTTGTWHACWTSPYEQLQLPILLLPHVSTLGAQDGDQECHAAIARLSKAPNIRVL
ncbi:MAG: putative polysaccharide pyruvyl transferase family protein, partial [Pseudarthrobacter sp.]|nr:putative polysaccharide pyruvyl transferase family protein [Pseudarthrobacter sp.]